MTEPNPNDLTARVVAKKVGTAGDPNRKRRGGEEYLFSIRDEVAELLRGSPFDVDSYLQSAYREVLKSPQLIQAAQDSGPTLLGAVMLGATLQLPIGGPLGQFYLTPRGENVGTRQDPKWNQMCVPMIGYRGFFELGYRSGRVRSFDYIVRRKGDQYQQGGNSARGRWFEWTQFADGEYDELDAEGQVRPLTGVVAIANLLSSTDPAWQFMSRAAIDRRKPKNTRYTPWEGPNAEAMYIKTPHRELAKFSQLSIASARAVEADELISEWNKTTQALETIHDDGARTYDDGAADEPADQATGEIAPLSDQEPPAAQPVTVPANVSGAHSEPVPERDPAEPSPSEYEEWLSRQQESR